MSDQLKIIQDENLIQTKLEVLNDEFSIRYKQNLISYIKTRIKSPESIDNKSQKVARSKKQIWKYYPINL